MVSTRIIVTIKRQRLTSLNLDFLNRIEGGFPRHIFKEDGQSFHLDDKEIQIYFSKPRFPESFQGRVVKQVYAGLYLLRMYSVLNVRVSDLTFTDFSVKFSKNQFEVKKMRNKKCLIRYTNTLLYISCYWRVNDILFTRHSGVINAVRQMPCKQSSCHIGNFDIS